MVAQANFNRSPNTPIAVTAAPAPAPCTIRGRGEYRSVWNMMILSEPPREVANGWFVGYLWRQRGQHLLQRAGHMQGTTYFSKPAFTTPSSASTTPTNLNTCPSSAASFLSLSKVSSNSGNRLMNSSPVGIPSSAAGIRDCVCTAAYDSSIGSLVGVADEEVTIRERMVSLRATSAPFRSSAGWGSC